MGLHVGVFGAEDLLGAIAGEVLDDVGELAAAVIALAGVAFGVLVGEDRAGGFEDGFADEVFRGDQFEAFMLAAGLVRREAAAISGSDSASGSDMRELGAVIG